jgi:outer membrane receptor for ferrienterochelin and colicins
MDVRLRRSTLAALLFMAVMSVPAWAQQSGVIAGRITDRQTGQPVGPARIDVVAGAGRIVATGFSANDGQFRLVNVPAGTHTLALLHVVGYRDERIENVVVTAGQTTTVNPQLAPAAFELAPVTVSVGRGQIEKVTEAPASVSVVSQLAIAERPAVSMTEHLRSVQGVDVVNAGIQSSNVVVRGFNNIFSGSLHMLTDYRIASVPSLRVNFLHFVPQTNEDMQRMEVVLGPAAALYGPNTANGVLHMITKSPFDEQLNTFSMTGGERSLLHLTGRSSHLITPTLGVKVSGQFMRAEDWNFTDPIEAQTRIQADDTDPTRRFLFRQAQPLGPDGQPLTEAELDRRIARIGIRDFQLQRWSADGRVDWRPTSDLSTVFSVGRTMSNTGVELTGIGAGQVQDWAYSYYQGRVNWRRVFAQAYLNTSDAGETYLLRTGQPVTDRSKVFVTQLQHGTDFGTMQSFTYGVDFIRTMPETDGTIHGVRDADDTMNEIGAYVQSTTRLTPKFDLVLAGRVDDHSHLPEMVFSPRAALVFKPTADQSFRATFNRAFSTPSSLNLFLDIDAGWAGTSIGPMGFRARAYGAGQDGIRFQNPAGGLYGMRSPSAAAVGGTPGGSLAVDPSVLYRLQIENFLRVAGAAGAPLAGFLRSLQADPLLPRAFVALDPVTSAMFDPAQIQDVPGIRESISETFEVGYKGVLANRLLLAADLWRERKENFVSPLMISSPLLLMHPAMLHEYLVPRLTAAFMAAGMPQAMAAAQADTTSKLIRQVPGAVVTSPDLPSTASDLILTYRNFGEVKLWGMDLGATVLLTDSWQFGVTASFVSDDHFKLELGGVPQIVALNAPAQKGTATLTYRNLVNGLNGELRVRHNSEFPVNSAGYVGMDGCVDHDFGGAIINEPCVQSFNIVDIGAGYRIPQLRGASIQLNIQNVFDTDFRAFIGTPVIGRMALLRLKYEF